MKKVFRSGVITLRKEKFPQDTYSLALNDGDGTCGLIMANRKQVYDIIMVCAKFIDEDRKTSINT